MELNQPNLMEGKDLAHSSPPSPPPLLPHSLHYMYGHTERKHRKGNFFICKSFTLLYNCEYTHIDIHEGCNKKMLQNKARNTPTYTNTNVHTFIYVPLPYITFLLESCPISKSPAIFSRAGHKVRVRYFMSLTPRKICESRKTVNNQN